MGFGVTLSNVWGAANPSFLRRDEEIMRYRAEAMKARKDHERVLEKATRTEEELARVRESSAHVEGQAASAKEDVASAKSLYAISKTSWSLWYTFHRKIPIFLEAESIQPKIRHNYFQRFLFQSQTTYQPLKLFATPFSF